MRNDLAEKIETWLSKYMSACAAASPKNISMLEHRICSAVYVAELSGDELPCIADLAKLLGETDVRTGRAVKRMRESGSIQVIADFDDDRIKRLQHDPDDLRMALSHLQPLYEELAALLAK